jgi:hypothetical protein
MEPQKKSRLLHRLRVTFRWLRITVWFFLFLVVVALAYLQLIGLPDYLRRPLLARLRERGVEAQYSNIRLGFGPEVVIDNGAFSWTDQPLSPRVSGETAIVHFDPSQLKHRRIKADSLRLTQGSLEIPLSATNGDTLVVNNVSLDIALLTNDAIHGQISHANFHGMLIDIEGSVTNFMALRDWKTRTNAASAGPGGHPGATNRPSQIGSTLREFADTLAKIHFVSQPHLTVTLGADGRDPDSLWTQLALDADDTHTPWGDVTGVRLTADCVHPMNADPGPFLKIHLGATNITTPRAAGRNVDLHAEISRAANSNLTANVTLALTDAKGQFFNSTQTNVLTAARLDWNGAITLHPSPWTLVSLTGKFVADRPATPWGTAQTATISGSLAATDGSPTANAIWGFWTNFNHWNLDWKADLTQVATPKMNLAHVQNSGRWQPPKLELTNLEAALYGSDVSGDVHLDVATRALDANIKSDLDPREVSHLLTGSAQKWMTQFTWDKAPHIAGHAGLVLPDWDKPGPDWWSEVLPTLRIAGDFSLEGATYRTLGVDSAQSTFTYSNEVWNLPNLRVARPEGNLDLAFTSSDATGDFLFLGDSTIDPQIVRPLFAEKQQSLFDQVTFTSPPQIHAEVRGNWREHGSLAFNTHVAVTNFTVRGEKINSLSDTVDYSNQLARFSDGLLVHDSGQLNAPLVEANFASKKISLSNIECTLDPATVERALGKICPAWLKLLIFDSPPDLRVSGAFIPGDDQGTDLHFAISGTNFHRENLKAHVISGKVDWVMRSVSVTNLFARLYEGTTSGWGIFDYEKKSTSFHGGVVLTRIQLPQIVHAFDPKTNHLEGAVDAWLSVAEGNSEDLNSWRATGRIYISQARLWDIKLFGVFSPILNSIIPGAGSSRAYQASTDLTVTNGVLITTNLEIRSTGFRLLYHGTVTLDKKKLDATAEALLLRDTPVIGRIFSLAFLPLSKLFEYKIGGTLSHPTYKSNTLNDFLHPFRTLKGFLPPEEPESSPPTSPTAPKNDK